MEDDFGIWKQSRSLETSSLNNITQTITEKLSEWENGKMVKEKSRTLVQQRKLTKKKME